MYTNLFCPFTCCPQHEGAEKPRGMVSKHTLRDHLIKCHQEELYKLNDNELESIDLHICRQCDDHVATSAARLRNHIKTKHIQTRKTTNQQIVTSKLYNPVKTASLNHWEAGLSWLDSFQPTPPTFRQSLISKVKFEIEDAVLTLFEDLIAVCVEVNKDPNNSELIDDYNYKREHIWKLPFIFEQLILAPKPRANSGSTNKNDTSIRKLIYHRIRLFRSGQLQQLYEESCLVHSRSRSSYIATPPDKNACAQEAADNDNFGACEKRLGSDLGIAPLNDTNIPILEKLFPKSLELNLRGLRRGRGQKKNTRSTTTTRANKKKIVFTPTEVIEHLSRLRRHKAPGVYQVSKTKNK